MGWKSAICKDNSGEFMGRWLAYFAPCYLRNVAIDEPGDERCEGDYDDKDEEDGGIAAVVWQTDAAEKHGNEQWNAATKEIEHYASATDPTQTETKGGAFVMATCAFAGGGKQETEEQCVGNEDDIVADLYWKNGQKDLRFIYIYLYYYE